MDEKTFNSKEVAVLLDQERRRTYTISALLISIQRSKMAGDNPILTNCLGELMNEIAGVTPQKAEPKDE